MVYVDMLYKGWLARDLEQWAQFVQNSRQQFPGWESGLGRIPGPANKTGQQDVPLRSTRRIDTGREERGPQGQALDDRHEKSRSFQVMANLLTPKTQG